MRAWALGLPLATVLVGCGHAAPPAPAPSAKLESRAPDEPECLVDRLPDPQPYAASSCAAGDACADACDAGDAAACMARGWELEGGGAMERAAIYYLRGCEAGLATGCTNYGSYMLDGNGGVVTDPPCAYRLHRWSCDTGESWGCGMVGWELISGSGVAADAAAGRAVLEESCATMGGFPCHVLAKEHVHGTFGEPDLDVARALFQRACDDDIPWACDDLAKLAP